MPSEVQHIHNADLVDVGPSGKPDNGKTLLKFQGVSCGDGWTHEAHIEMDSSAVARMKDILRLVGPVTQEEETVTLSLHSAHLISAGKYKGFEDPAMCLEFGGTDETMLTHQVLIQMEPRAVADMKAKLCDEKRFNFCHWCGEALG